MIEHTVRGDVTSLDQLRDGDGQFFTGTVNVLGGVDLYGMKLERLPVRFGTVDGIFSCSYMQLTSLEGAPVTVGGYFYCSYMQLTSLEGVPVTIGGNFVCFNNRLTSLVGVHKILRQIGGGLYIAGNPITSGGIGLLLVEGLTKIVTDQPAFEIINRYFGQGKKGLLRCQEALHDAGFEEFARL